MKVVSLAIIYTPEEEKWVERLASKNLRAWISPFSVAPTVLWKDAPNFYSLSREVNLIPWHISNAVRTLR